MFNTFQANYFLDSNVNKSRLIDEYLQNLCAKSPSLENTIKSYGKSTIKDFILKINDQQSKDYDQTQGLSKIIYDYVSPLLGREIALQTISAINKQKISLTANHHGVDYFAQSAQGTMLFTIMLRQQNVKQRAIPVIACANISLNNITYPRGILIYGVRKNIINEIPYKIPLFPDRYKTRAVWNIPPINKEYVKMALKNVRYLYNTNMISVSSYRTILEVLENEYLNEFVIGQNSYTDQAVILNYKLWKKIFKDNLSDVNVVYLSLEDIAAKLIEIDLYKADSLLNIILFDPEVREKVISGLCRCKACWDSQILNCDVDLDREKRGVGTHFFWGGAKSGKRFSLFLKSYKENSISLVGCSDNSDEIVNIPLDRDILAEKLRTKEIIPSLFLSYLVLSFARGITCVGGYYQSEYLPVMKKKIIAALKDSLSYGHYIGSISKISASKYLSGMQAIMTKTDESSIVPAGPIEIIASGGISDSDVKNILEITILNAHKASMIDTVTDLKVNKAENTNWKEIISNENYLDLKSEVVIRNGN
jgi:hypothetical protein